MITQRTARQNVMHVQSIFRQLNDAAQRAMNSGPPEVVQLEPFGDDDSDDDFEGSHGNSLADRDDSFGLFMGKFLEKGGRAE